MYVARYHSQASTLGYPFESYLNGPDTVKDPWDLRTDVYQFFQ